MRHFFNSICKIKRGKRLRGDTILEVVVATAILGSILVATFNILQRAVDTNVNIKNRVVALNIAREGLEAVRNIRDTNWLKYSGDKRGKWLCHDTPSNPDNCKGSSFTGNTDLLNDNNLDGSGKGPYYTVDFNTTAKRYYLEAQTGMPGGWIDFETSQANRENYRLYLTGTAPYRYTHEASGNNQSVFYRQIFLDIESPYESDVPVADVNFCTTANTCNKARLKVVVKVYWQEDSRQRSVSLEGHLFDFFERDEY